LDQTNLELRLLEIIRITKRLKREKRLENTYQEEKKRWMHLTQRELELAGIFLYWGEGAKYLQGPLSLNNTDPEVIRFTLYWMIEALKVPKEKIKVCLHLYKDMNIDKEKKYWSETLHMPLSQFATPYIKQSNRSDLTHKGFGHGTCGLLVSNILLKEKVMMTIKAISDSYNAKI
jgi:hypothetical protein